MLFIILVSLAMTFISGKMLNSTRCIHGFMSNLIKKSWTDSIIHVQMKPYKKVSFLSWPDRINIHYVTSSGIMYVLQRIRKTYRSRWLHISLFKMVSKVAVLMFIGQIILAFLLFYLLPKSEGHNNNVSSQKEFNKDGQPIISLNNGKN